VKLFLGLQLVKWVLEVLKRIPYTAQRQKIVVRSYEAGLKKVKVYVKDQETDVRVCYSFFA
jgi:hypothetical protein